MISTHICYKIYHLAIALPY